MIFDPVKVKFYLHEERFWPPRYLLKIWFRYNGKKYKEVRAFSRQEEETELAFLRRIHATVYNGIFLRQEVADMIKNKVIEINQDSRESEVKESLEKLMGTQEIGVEIPDSELDNR